MTKRTLQAAKFNMRREPEVQSEFVAGVRNIEPSGLLNECPIRFSLSLLRLLYITETRPDSLSVPIRIERFASGRQAKEALAKFTIDATALRRGHSRL